MAPEKLDTKNFIIENNIIKGVQKPVDCSRTVGNHIFDVLNANADHVLQIDAETGKKVTNREIKDRSISCALWMKKEGVTQNDTIVVCTDNNLDTNIPIFATLFLDAVCFTWSHNIAINTARCYIKKYSPKIIFVCEKSADIVEEALKLEKSNVKVIVIGRHSTLQTLDEILAFSTGKEIEKFIPTTVKKPDDLVFIMMSSGSSGMPKGVMLSRKCLLEHMLGNEDKLNGDYRILWYSTPDWLSCIINILSTLINQETQIIPTYCDIHNFCQLIEKYKINCVFTVPFILYELVKSNVTQKYDLASLNKLVTTGAKINGSILESLQFKMPSLKIFQRYGLTELSIVSESQIQPDKYESVGRISQNYHLRIVDPSTGKILGPHEHGEIRVLSPAVMIGYYDNPEETKQAFDQEGWYRTGDIGYYDEDGDIFIVDRMKELINYRYYNISPAEIEAVLMTHAAVEDVAVVPIPHEVDEARPAALVKKVANAEVTEEELVAMTTVLEDYKRLSGGVYFVDNLPKTSTGKPARAELKKMILNLIKV